VAVTKRKTRLTKVEREIAAMYRAAYLAGQESCEAAFEQAVYETREHVLKTFERHIGGDPTRVFADKEAKSQFLVLVNHLRGQR
jgi:methylphosphotriester-DNA--protein-cysteine methyltransferase